MTEPEDRDVGELCGEFREFRAEMRGFREQNNRVLSAMRADVTTCGPT